MYQGLRIGTVVLLRESAGGVAHFHTAGGPALCGLTPPRWRDAGRISRTCRVCIEKGRDMQVRAALEAAP